MSNRIVKMIEYMLCGLLVVGVLVYFQYRKDNHNSFGYCTVISSGGFGSKARTNYEYKIAGKIYEHSVKRKVKNLNENKNFIITYDSLNPKNHNPIFSLRYQNRRQIDSLIKHIDPSNFGSMWTFNANNARVKTTHED